MAKKAEKIREKTEEAKKEQVSAVKRIQQLEDTYKKTFDQVTYTADQGKNFVNTFKSSQETFKKTFSFFPVRRRDRI